MRVRQCVISPTIPLNVWNYSMFRRFRGCFICAFEEILLDGRKSQGKCKIYLKSKYH
jgi:hypothetical protein